jgi:SAM-dependent methyltransferase
MQPEPTTDPKSADSNTHQTEGASPATISLDEQLAKMRNDWDSRASENARFYVNTACEQWTDEEFYASGADAIRRYILTDQGNICQGRTPKEMRVLEIGCGAGRVTRSLAHFFGEVHAVDVSGEMVRQAQNAVDKFRNAFVYQNNGMDLSVIPAKLFDFAFSCYVFQHIPSREIIQSYVREVHRLLRPGALFKFQVQGNMKVEVKPDDTWVGVPFSEEQIVLMASECGFESRYRIGLGEQEFWNWFFKPFSDSSTRGAEIRLEV